MNSPSKRHLRRSQTVSTFGPGAIVDLRDESIMMVGLDWWPDQNPVEIHEPNLEKALGVSSFRTPTTVDISYNGKDLPFSFFPEWMVCPQCHRLAPLTFFRNALTSSNSVTKCPDCQKKVYPARLIVACPHGHIDDFPWVDWIRRGSSPCNCERPALMLVSAGRTATLADLIVKCKNKGCDGYRSLSGATRQENLKFMKCSGRRPWLLDKEICSENVVPLQRGASNVYFPLTTSAISIPPWSSSIQSVLNNYWSVLRAIPVEAIPQTVVGMNLPARLGVAADLIIAAVIERKSGESGIDQPPTEQEIRRQEWLALRQPTPGGSPTGDFKTRPAPVHPSLQDLISKVVLVDRLREVRVQLGFTRINPPDPDPAARYEITRAPLSRTHKDWLPAIEVHGEGIYLELNEDALVRWVDSPTGALILARAKLIQKNYEEMCDRRKWKPSREITPRFLLAHSFAHTLIRQLSLESGYSSASLRERLYIFEPGADSGSAGILVYTSTPDSEGSLGGLVRQGLPDRLAPTVQAGIQNAAWCSSDPLCIESEGQGHDALNLAACHACLLLSETCCEEFNRLLDRAMLVGTMDKPEAGFFYPLLEA